MKIWKLKFEVDKYDNFIPQKPFTVDEIMAFDGRSHLKSWGSVFVERMEPQKGLELSDAPGFIIPVISKNALEYLYKLIEKDVEILPLMSNEGEYFALNITLILDAINYNESEYKTYRDGKRIMVFEKYSFIPERIINRHIFKIIDEKRRFAFVSDEFKEAVETNNLKGFIFDLVWEK